MLRKNPSSFSSLLILPPETISYNFEDNQDYPNDNKNINDNKNTVDIITYGTPIEDDKNEETNNEVRPKKQNMKEFHYHKHKHLHEYDQKLGNKPKSIQDHLSSNTHGHRHMLKNDNQYQSQNQKVKSNDYRGDDSKDANDDNINFSHSHSRKRQYRNQRHGNYPRNSGHLHHGDLLASDSGYPRHSYHTPSHSNQQSQKNRHHFEEHKSRHRAHLAVKFNQNKQDHSKEEEEEEERQTIHSKPRVNKYKKYDDKGRRVKK